MKNKNIYDEIFDKPCSVCGEIIKKDIYDQGNCPYCKWKNNFLADENPDSVLYPNLISLNKAKQLYIEGKPFEPNLNEFIEAFLFYGEMEFSYNGKRYGLTREKNKDIYFFTIDSENYNKFENVEDFKNNAKVDGKLLKDIWNDTTDRYWLQ